MKKLMRQFGKNRMKVTFGDLCIRDAYTSIGAYEDVPPNWSVTTDQQVRASQRRSRIAKSGEGKEKKREEKRKALRGARDLMELGEDGGGDNEDEEQVAQLEATCCSASRRSCSASSTRVRSCESASRNSPARSSTCCRTPDTAASASVVLDERTCPSATARRTASSCKQSLSTV